MLQQPGFQFWLRCFWINWPLSVNIQYNCEDVSGWRGSEVMRMTLECVYSLNLKITAYVRAKSLQSCLTLQTARLLCPWNSPGKVIGVGCHFFLQGIWPRDQTHVSCIGRCILYRWATKQVPVALFLLFLLFIGKILKLQWAVVLTDMPVLPAFLVSARVRW